MADIEVTVQPAYQVDVVVDQSNSLEVSVGDLIEWAEITGKPITVVNEIPTGLVNNINKIFYTTSSFIDSYIWVYLNGLKLGYNDYSITAQNQITLIEAPSTGDVLAVDYIK